MMKALCITVLVLISVESFSQTIHRSVIASAGNDVDTETFSISWTLGEIAINTLNSDEIVLSQGFHQGNLFINAIEGALYDFHLKTYPNPVINKLIIESSELNQLYEIIDVNGRVLENGFIDSNPFELDLTNLPSAPYFLRVEQKLTHKIIKE